VPAAATTTAVAATIASATTAAPAEFRLRPRFVHDERTPAHFCPIELLDGRLRIFFGLHLDEREAAGAACRIVTHHAHRFDGARLTEQILELVLPCAEREIPNEQLPTHVLSPTNEPSLNGPSTLLAAKCEGIESENGSVGSNSGAKPGG
jgi:hypothetical protein